jgi:hypothetical protein
MLTQAPAALPRSPSPIAYVSLRQHTSGHVSKRQPLLSSSSPVLTLCHVAGITQHTSAYVITRPQHTSAYVSTRPQHTSAYVSTRPNDATATHMLVASSESTVCEDTQIENAISLSLSPSLTHTHLHEEDGTEASCTVSMKRDMKHLPHQHVPPPRA